MAGGQTAQRSWTPPSPLLTPPTGPPRLPPWPQVSMELLGPKPPALLLHPSAAMHHQACLSMHQLCSVVSHFPCVTRTSLQICPHSSHPRVCCSSSACLVQCPMPNVMLDSLKDSGWESTLLKLQNMPDSQNSVTLTLPVRNKAMPLNLSYAEGRWLYGGLSVLPALARQYPTEQRPPLSLSLM